MDTIELTVTSDNVQDWTYLEGVREVVQGYLDNPNKSFWKYEDEVLTLTNRDTYLARKVLLTGFSSKRNDPDQIGKYGDGLISGFCCLLRDGIGIEIQNSHLTWVPKVEYSEKFQQEVVVIEETNGDEDNEDFVVKLSGISEDQFKEIYDNTLPFQEELGEMHETSKGAILLAPKFRGKIYCGGLFVAAVSGMEFGYNFKPRHLPLDRDRMSVRDFDTKWATGEMWNEVNSKKEITQSSSNALVKALHSNKTDVQYSRINKVDESVAEQAFEVYEENYKGKVLAESYEEKNRLEASGYKNVEYIGKPAFVRVVKQSAGYQAINQKVVVKSGTEMIEEFKDKWYDHFTTEMLDEFDNLVSNIKKLS